VLHVLWPDTHSPVMPLGDKIKELLGSEKPKNPGEHASKLITALNTLEMGAASYSTEGADKALSSISKHLAALKVCLFGDTVTKDVVHGAVTELLRTDALYLLVKHLVQLDFEARKDAASVFGACVRVKAEDGQRALCAAYVEEHPFIMEKLTQGWVGKRQGTPCRGGPSILGGFSCMGCAGTLGSSLAVLPLALRSQV
jgi:hypothetical protein